MCAHVARPRPTSPLLRIAWLVTDTTVQLRRHPSRRCVGRPFTAAGESVESLSCGFCRGYSPAEETLLRRGGSRNLLPSRPARTTSNSPPTTATRAAYIVCGTATVVALRHSSKLKRPINRVSAVKRYMQLFLGTRAAGY